ncbi:hypothetical protein SSS_05232 [Sarcoptes scabiei]|nr:hypothetical protein SSS_05232 [Sarcoptes scabiei]
MNEISEDQPKESSIDFRILLSSSKFEQIEKELMRRCLKQFRCRQHSKLCQRHYQNFVERTLIDIEEDLHKILLLLMKQLELFTGHHHHHNRNENSISQQRKSICHHRIEEKIPESEFTKLCSERDKQFERKFKHLQSFEGKINNDNGEIHQSAFNISICQKINDLDLIKSEKPQRILTQIQGLIKELHLEHDWITRATILSAAK